FNKFGKIQFPTLLIYANFSHHIYNGAHLVLQRHLELFIADKVLLYKKLR
ncbi:unnamed protein product, partial [marine sediment metagenome]